MSLEPRLSAISLFAEFPDAEPILKTQFTDKEWKYYQKLLSASTNLQTSSMGRMIDAVAAILKISSYNNYEAEAAIKLESMARNSQGHGFSDYRFEICGDIINWKPAMTGILDDIQKGKDIKYIAESFFNSLGYLIFQISRQAGVRDLAFSGGVFQNVALVNTLLNQKPEDTRLWFHKSLSPNDENIPFGQIAYYDRYVK